LIPLSEHDNMEQCEEHIRNLHSSLLALLPNVLLSTMTVLFKMHQSYHMSQQQGNQRTLGGGAVEYQRELHEKANNLVAFAGMIQAMLTGDLFARLISLSSAMTSSR